MDRCERNVNKHVSQGAHAEAIQELQRGLALLRSQYFEAAAQYTEQIKAHAICAPPDQPNLTTTPWKVGEVMPEPPNKGELTRRTKDSAPTTQKKTKIKKK